MIAVVLWAAGALAVALDLPWWLRGLALPAVLLAPGLPWARRLGGATPLQRALDAAWIGVALSVPQVVLLRLAGGGAALLLGVSGALVALGLADARGRRPGGSWSRGEAVGCLAVVAAVALLAFLHGARLSRGIETFWYLDGADAGGSPPVQATPGPGIAALEPLGWPGAGAARIVDPEGDGGVLHLASGGRAVVVLQGPVGAHLRLSQGERRAEGRIERDVVEDPQEGPVPRYLDRGAVAVPLDAEPGPLRVEVALPAGTTGPTTLHLLGGPEAVWALDADGSLRYVHYYQILNIVENQRWAAELLSDRWLTLSQPPLWSHVLALAVVLVDPDLRGANLLLLLVTVLLGCSAVRLLAVLAPRAPPLAWLLPAAAAAVHLKLAVDPGSTNFPDSLFAAALVGGVAALHQPGPLRVAALGIGAGLLRYPGVVDLLLAAGAQRLATGRTHRAGLRALLAATAALAVAGLALAAATGNLRETLGILWFETIPEHYHGEGRPLVLLGRLPAFYGTWLLYSGGCLLLALAPRRCRAAWTVLGAALAWSALLCTIDHLTTHYFFPLVPMAAVAVGLHAACRRSAALRWGLPAAGLGGLVLFLLRGHP